jgi:hypothetical protein
MSVHERIPETVVLFLFVKFFRYVLPVLMFVASAHVGKDMESISEVLADSLSPVVW